MRIALIAFIDDPFDPPGHERFGGGQAFWYDLIRYLIRQGDKVDVVTRLNDPEKERFEQIGFSLRLHRISVGPPREVNPAELAPLVDELAEATEQALGDDLGRFDILHSQYWLSGDVARRFAESHRITHVHHPLSFLREKRIRGEPETIASARREQAELAIFATVDWLIMLSPTELITFRSLYPECANTHVTIVPHGADHALFFPRPESPSAYVRRAARRLEQRT